jgi:hypothetical protein
MKTMIMAVMVWMMVSFNVNANGLNKLFPQMACTFESCQRIGFEEVYSAKSTALNTMIFRKSGYPFLEYMSYPHGTCFLRFEKYTKRLTSVSYLYTLRTQTLQKEMSVLIESFSKKWGSPKVSSRYKKESFEWSYEGHTICLILDDMDDDVSIIIQMP